MNQSNFSILVDGNPTTALPTETIFILSVHDPFTEITFVDVEIRAV